VRVIAGAAGGTRLVGVPPGVRPVSDRAREGLFSSLGERVDGASVLDLFAGTGALGIEALSRGAAHATFVDRSRAAADAIAQNLSRTHLQGRGTIRAVGVHEFLMRMDNSESPTVCFVDPPYRTRADEIERALSLLAVRWLTRPGWTTVLTRPKRSPTLVIPVEWRVVKRLEYGDSILVCYREE
jgi:16S rRNA (guanine966-N2)-methyltransferase